MHTDTKIRVYLCAFVVKNLNLVILSVTLQRRSMRKRSVKAKTGVNLMFCTGTALQKVYFCFTPYKTLKEI
ncbi:hypothetical protein FFJ24_025020 [Pedobacter sp. KBS0701]|uniref:hypothetical protein n=1 Tax=Pedobacter sp. KBS0701 TaxID=2578106 RepID=UPI00110DFE86|nr:hypothetical protein [Pedobacter sp. KBS0701]QDW27922.1 hypothetical protein FFJ24_025020 [Pedobacter sp. KBS0701]